jgi:hypothetical protein
MRHVADYDNRLRLTFNFCQEAFDFLGANRQFVREAVVAEEIIVIVSSFEVRALSVTSATRTATGGPSDRVFSFSA